jgi:hypothetical protein
LKTPGNGKKRSAAWHRAMRGARKQALGMLEQLGESADHLPEADRKKAHAKLVREIKHVIAVIDEHLRDATR